MGTQCKSATLPDAVSPILRPTNSVTGYQNHWVLKTSGKTVSARMSQKTCHLPIVTYVCGTTDMEMRFLWCYCVAISTALLVSWPCFCSGAVLLCKRSMCALWLHVSINQIVVDGPKEAPRKRHGKEILTIKKTCNTMKKILMLLWPVMLLASCSPDDDFGTPGSVEI